MNCVLFAKKIRIQKKHFPSVFYLIKSMRRVYKTYVRHLTLSSKLKCIPLFKNCFFLNWQQFRHQISIEESMGGIPWLTWKIIIFRSAWQTLAILNGFLPLFFSQRFRVAAREEPSEKTVSLYQFKRWDAMVDKETWYREIINQEILTRLFNL